jgi:hypothetical protein
MAATDQGVDACAGRAHHRDERDPEANLVVRALLKRLALARLVLRIVDEGGRGSDAGANQESVPQRIAVTIHLPNTIALNLPESTVHVEGQRGR